VVYGEAMFLLLVPVAFVSGTPLAHLGPAVSDSVFAVLSVLAAAAGLARRLVALA
jgi:hypothetical protein